MVGDRVPAVGAGFAGLGDDGDEVPELGVFQHAGEFTSGPKFRAGLVDAFDALEGAAGGGGGQLFTHRFITNINIDVFYILPCHSWKSELSSLLQTPFA